MLYAIGPFELLDLFFCMAEMADFHSSFLLNWRRSQMSVPLHLSINPLLLVLIHLKLDLAARSLWAATTFRIRSLSKPCCVEHM